VLWTHHGAPLNIRFWLPADVLPQLLPFLTRRAARRGLGTHGLECSGWGHLSLAEALFRIARLGTEQESEEAASFGTISGT
jgi:hypothetical protein